MGTRTIVTSQPDLACSVCERRLLRGEQPEVFLAAGEPRLVCELCAPRATHEGWLRESEEPSGSQPPPRTRRGRSLFGRLLAAARPESPPDPGEQATGEPDAPPAAGGEVASPSRQAAGAEQALETPGAPEEVQARAGEEWSEGELQALARLERSLAVFNDGEYRRRIASLARSLGAPSVSVREDEDLGTVAIVVAWELCWYRYEVDIDLPQATLAITAQGTELSELAGEDRLSNAAADELGMLSLTGTPV